MNQEDYNEMMRYPWEPIKIKKIEWQRCPACGGHYCGDGVQPCIECAAPDKANTALPAGSEESC